jgi:hypothetical protein
MCCRFNAIVIDEQVKITTVLIYTVHHRAEHTRIPGSKTTGNLAHSGALESECGR